VSTRWGFRLVYALLACVALVAAAGFGRGWAVTRTVTRPASCKAPAAFVACIGELVVAQGGLNPRGTCERAGKGWLCDMKIDTAYGVSCYAVTAGSAREGFPLIESATEKQC
jgi:hypothetical protein